MRTFAATLFALGLVALARPAFADAVDDLDAAERKTTVGGMKNGPFGAGLILGEPTALSAKYLFAPHSGVQAHVGYGVGRRGRFILIGDYVFHVRNVLPRLDRVGILVPTVGVGGRLGIVGDDAIIGVRFPIGIGLWLSPVPIEIFLEVAPGIGLLPSTDFLIDGGLGARWYF
ncbi:MAG: hypothetical protein RMA76_01925 [Deltaproteobacteria bacterium]|jgi:hypothetical protein